MNVDGATRLEALLAYLKQSRGFDFGVYKRPTLGRRIERRIQAVGVQDYDGYINYLEVHPEEFAVLFDTILINVTTFFRDLPAWEYLQSDVLPGLLSSKGPNDPIRVWAAGCATGEEAYTLAMVLAEALGPDEIVHRVKIYGTDVDDAALAKARHGMYSLKEVDDVPRPLLEKYFTRTNDDFAFDKELRRVVIFGRHDLAEDAPISRIDLLCCRNTLMYFDLETQGRILARFHFGLNRYGVLFLGKAEMLLTHGNTYVPVNLKHRIFAKIPEPEQRERAVVDGVGSEDHRSPQVEEARLSDAAFLVANVPQLVFDAEGILRRHNEQARAFFRLSPKDPGRMLLDLDLATRLPDLAGWVKHAVSERRALVMKRVPWTGNAGAARFLDIQVVPLQIGNKGPLGTSICFADVTPQVEMEQELRGVQTELGAANEELHTTNEELQSTIEELETTNEELQSTNEELETTNEELQSSNEEMETMNEELQSTNEELQAINEELRKRSEETRNANGFLSSILSGIRSGVAVLDTDFQVRVWNAKAQVLWGLHDEEVVGKHFFNLDFNLPVDKLRQPLRDVISGAAGTRELTLEAVNRRGKTFSCRVIATPLRDFERNVTGVILLMEDSPEVVA